MLYLYDREIVKDLQNSFNPQNVSNPVVKVVGPEAAIGIAAQMQSDNISFPIVVLDRNENTDIDETRINFTRLHKGVEAVFDKERNEYYNEKVIPIKLSYTLTLLATNAIDIDELYREILFKYSQMYFLQIHLPYECKRTVRFGIIISPDSSVSRDSGTAEYLKEGKLYQIIIPLKVEGAVLVHYTPVKLTNVGHIIDAE